MASHNSTNFASSNFLAPPPTAWWFQPSFKKTFRSSQVLCFLWSHEPKDLTLLGPWWKTHHVPGILFAAAPKTFSYHSWRGRRVSLKFHQSIHHKWNILLQTICPSQMLGKNLVPSQSFRNPRHYFSKLIEQLHFYTKIINETQQAWQNFRRIGLPIVSKLGASQFFVASRDPAEVHGFRKCILPSGSLIWSKWSCKPTMDNVPIFRKVIFEPGSRKTMRLQPQIESLGVPKLLPSFSVKKWQLTQSGTALMDLFLIVAEFSMDPFIGWTVAQNPYGFVYLPGQRET